MSSLHDLKMEKTADDNDNYLHITHRQSEPIITERTTNIENKY